MLSTVRFATCVIGGGIFLWLVILVPPLTEFDAILTGIPLLIAGVILAKTWKMEDSESR